MASLLIAAAWAYGADETWVVLPGLGPVPISDAIETCQAGQPAGAVMELVAKQPPRTSVFQAIAGRLLAQPPEERQSYWQYNFSIDWPTREIDVRYTPPGDAYPAGVIPACSAVGIWYTGRAMKIGHACATSKEDCRNALGDDDHDLAKAALKAAGTGDGVRDPIVLALNGVSGLATYRDPKPFLQAACDAPGAAMKQQRLIDGTDLLAARRACLQMLVAAKRTTLTPLGLPCPTPWSDVADDDPFVWVEPTTDAGLTDRYVQEQIDTLTDRLVRMDPSHATCEAPWAMVWRKETVKFWREGQMTRACADDALGLGDRAHLCPTLLEATSTSCDSGNRDACHRQAHMLAAGLQTEADVAGAADQFLSNCLAGHAPSCQVLPEYGAPLAQRLARAAADARSSARDQLRTWAPHLPTTWVTAQIVALLEGALVAADGPEVEALLSAFADRLDSLAIDGARARLAALPPPTEPPEEAP